MSQPLAIQLNSLTMPAAQPALQGFRAHAITQSPVKSKLDITPQTDQTSFANTLNAKQNVKAEIDALDPQIKAKMKKAANDFVSISLYQPLLKQLREDPFKTDLFGGGMAEDMFTQQMDQVIASDLSKSSSGLFGDLIFEDFARIALTNKTNIKVPDAESAAHWKSKLPQPKGS